jgi:hypothetical protein
LIQLTGMMLKAYKRKLWKRHIDFANLDTDLATKKKWPLKKNTTKVKGVKVVRCFMVKRFCKPTTSEEKHTDKLVDYIDTFIGLKERRKKQHDNKCNVIKNIYCSVKKHTKSILYIRILILNSKWISKNIVSVLVMLQILLLEISVC